MLRCLENDGIDKVLKELHDGPIGGHFSGDTIAHKVLRAGYYWPTLFKDTHAQARKCELCQKNAGKENKLAFLLQLVKLERPFQ